MALVVANQEESYPTEHCTCIVKDTINTENCRFILKVPVSTSQAQLYADVCAKCGYVKGSFDLVFSPSELTKDNKHLSDISVDETNTETSLFSIGFKPNQKNMLQVRERDGEAVEIVRPARSSDDVDLMIPPPPPAQPLTAPSQRGHQRKMAVSTVDTASLNEFIKKKSDEILNRFNSPVAADDVIPTSNLRYVGLVNQAMTCYLNSLIQTLYMTPEFRNALYKWEYNCSDKLSTNIPYQLQKLFLLLQTTPKQSVETTGLTGSFGWDSSEAWQQHDIQELCRVMFDALEKKFEGTEQAELIKVLYEGTMKDYVQCCECSHESARDDTFLDVPITIKPFGSTKSYKSVMEGLNAFVEPETLDETNQYYCEKCEKKCDAKKGLKFTKFPYLLTLQLKRFDFDYSTMHRIKLNDRMWFPQILNLNSFIDDGLGSDEVSVEDPLDGSDEIDTAAQTVPPDEDSSSHDSGHDLDAHSSQRGGGERTASGAGGATSDGGAASDGNHGDQRASSEEEASSVDEGIDIESSSSSSVAMATTTRRKHRSSATWWVNDDEQIQEFMKDGPFVYELFSIMVHSGSAAGGHYYAYIKSFENGRWYSFNDQIVSPVTHSEIEKTFGGSPYPSSSSYYSSFSSSTNAYMLMYRKIDPLDNAVFTRTENLPKHIKLMMEQEEQEEKNRKMRLEQERNMCSIRLFCRHHSLFRCQVQSIVEETFEFHKDIELDEAVKQAHLLLKLDPNVVPVERCRLVKYDHINDVLDRSYDIGRDDMEHNTFSQMLGGVRTAYLFDLLLETRELGERFEIYEPGGVTVKVYVANPNNMCFYDPIIIRAAERHTVMQLKSNIAQRIRCSPLRLLVAYEKYSGECHLMQSINRTLKQEGFYRSAKVFVDILSEEDARLVGEQHPIYLEDTILWGIIDRMANIITINIALPPAEDNDSVSPSKDTEQSPTTDIKDKSSSDARTLSGSSSDEGVGSLGGSSANGAPPPGSEEFAPDGVTEPPVSPIRGNGPDGCHSNNDCSLSQNEIRGFWRTPEMGEGEIRSGPPPGDIQENIVAPERRRNNSYDNGAGFSHLSSDFQGQLQQRLEGYALAGSPTSSLRCEDGDSTHSGPGSTDLDFDDDTSRDNDDAQGDSHPSEGSSLSTSCSTLDSTDTLCNTTDRLPTLAPDPLGPNYIFYTDPEPAGIPPVPGAKRYPGHAVACARPGTSHYDKALLYADDVKNNDVTTNKTDDVTLDGDVGKGTGDAPAAKKVQGCMKKPIVTSEPVKSVAWVDESDVIKTPQCASSCAPSCGVYDDFDASKEPESFSFSSPGHSPKQVNGDEQTTETEADPDNGEAMDTIVPLLDEMPPSGPSTSSTGVKSPQGSAFDPVHPQSKNRNRNSSTLRERTISNSSEGWGITGDFPSHKSFFFKVVAASQASVAKNVDAVETVMCKVLTVEIDKRMPLLALKRHLAYLVDTPTRRFCVYKQYASGQEVEMFTLTDDFKLVTDGTHFIVRLGRALCKDEYRCKLFQLELAEEETAKPLMNWIVQRDMTIEEARKQLCNDLAEQCDIQGTNPDRLRIRKKSWRSPGQVFLSEDRFGVDISLYGSLEFFVEFLSGPEPKTQRSQLVLLCRRWRPTELQFDDFHEVVLNEDPSQSYLGYTADHVRERLAEHSGIEKENIQVAKGRGMFPYRISVLDAHKELDWVPTERKPHTYSLHLTDDGTVVFYKDKTEELRECPEEERNRIKSEELKSDSTSCVSSKRSSSAPSSPTRPISYRRERALKIYTVDTSPTPKKRDVTTEL